MQIEDLSQDYYHYAAELYQRNIHLPSTSTFQHETKRTSAVGLNELMVNKTGANLARKLREQKDR
tara:strand:- start:87 stop:281 length:195 start_codon:yes stop_codon:yes gene_type:complete